jgi:serine/threonine protein kinase
MMIGQVIGSYRIEQKIGEGGMGSVYRGRDLMLEREVAVKALRPELARQPELVSRFRAEAVTLAKLNHSNIAVLYNFLRHGEEYYMAMEFVRGRTLEEVIKQDGAIAIERAVRLFCQALEGIAHAHAFGVIHRDIKPANLMLSPTDRVKVMDFGIARVLGTARQTKTGRLIGTLEYMSPEQMRGQETDARSDLYSLGIVLYEMLTGRAPFECDSDYELMRAQVEDQPPSPREFNGEISTAVELAVMRAIAKDPAGRFQSASEFRAALIAAVPSAAVKNEQEEASSAVDAGLKATRYAQEVNLFPADFEQQFESESAIKPGVARSSSRSSGYDSNTGTYAFQVPFFLLSAKNKLESGLGPRWMRSSGAAVAALALAVGGAVYYRGRVPVAQPKLQVEQSTMTPTATPQSIAIEPVAFPSPPSPQMQSLPMMDTSAQTPVKRQVQPASTRRLIQSLATPRPLTLAPTPIPQRPLETRTYPSVAQTYPTPKLSPTPKPQKTVEMINAVRNAAEKLQGLFKKKKSKD